MKVSTGDPVVDKYVAPGLGREAVSFAVLNYGDNPTKVPSNLQIPLSEKRKYLKNYLAIIISCPFGPVSLAALVTEQTRYHKYVFFHFVFTVKF